MDFVFSLDLGEILFIKEVLNRVIILFIGFYSICSYKFQTWLYQLNEYKTNCSTKYSPRLLNLSDINWGNRNALAQSECLYSHSQSIGCPINKMLITITLITLFIGLGLFLTWKGEKQTTKQLKGDKKWKT